MKDVNELMLLSEFQGSNKSAWVCKDTNTKQYIAIGYQNSQELLREQFLTESEAEDWAEDWVLIYTPQ